MIVKKIVLLYKRHKKRIKDIIFIPYRGRNAYYVLIVKFEKFRFVEMLKIMNDIFISIIYASQKMNNFNKYKLSLYSLKACKVFHMELYLHF